MTSTFSHWSKNSLFDITVKICNIGPELWWGICAERTTLEAESDSVLIINAGSGRNIPGNLRNVEDAGEQNTAAKNAKRAHGYFTGIGVLQLLNELLTFDAFPPYSAFVIRPSTKRILMSDDTSDWLNRAIFLYQIICIVPAFFFNIIHRSTHRSIPSLGWFLIRYHCCILASNARQTFQPKIWGFHFLEGKGRHISWTNGGMGRKENKWWYDLHSIALYWHHFVFRAGQERRKASILGHIFLHWLAIEKSRDWTTLHTWGLDIQHAWKYW